MKKKTMAAAIASLIATFLVPTSGHAYDDPGSLVQGFSFPALAENPTPDPWPRSWPSVTAESGLLVSPQNVTPQIGMQWEGNAARIYVSGNRSVKRIEVRMALNQTSFVVNQTRPLVLDLPNARPERFVVLVLFNRNGTKKIHRLKITTFSTCEALNKVFLGGIATNSGFLARVGPDPTIAPSKATEIYLQNDYLDSDKDLMACER